MAGRDDIYNNHRQDNIALQCGALTGISLYSLVVVLSLVLYPAVLTPLDEVQLYLLALM